MVEALTIVRPRKERDCLATAYHRESTKEITGTRVPANLVWAEGERSRPKQQGREIAARDLPSNMKAVQQERATKIADDLPH
jgi:hypothetical protein